MNKGRGRIFKRSDGAWLVYLPKRVCEDTNFPYENNEIVKVSFEKTSKKLTIELFPQSVICPSCGKQAERQEIKFDGTARYKCSKCGEEFNE